ncbi:MAG: glycosyltransferase family 4 protein [Bacteroidota bacterium]|nr:glycosyltransferase family 4 protein [Bacteroidota bacterium]
MNNNVLFIECTRHYPFKYTASNTKMELIGRGLIEQGDKVSVINPVIGDFNLASRLVSGQTKGLNYYCFLRRRSIVISLLFNLIQLHTVLKKLKDRTSTNTVVLLETVYPLYLVYIAMAKFSGYKIVNIIHEWHLAWPRKGLTRVSAFLFDKTFGYFVDGILPISLYLENKIRRFHKPMLRVPILADYADNEYDMKYGSTVDNYFFFCGGAVYFRVIKVLIDSFCLFVRERHDRQQLQLVLYGSEQEMHRIASYINETNYVDRIRILPQLSNEELKQKMERAIALLIPLSENSEIDKARFSQKIAEYLSARRPIITVNVGEIQYYFKDAVNAYIVPTLEASLIADKMKKAVEDPAESDLIGLNGYQVGLSCFDYKKHGSSIHRFLLEINKS